LNLAASHSPQLAAGQASEWGTLLFLADPRFSPFYCGELQFQLLWRTDMGKSRLMVTHPDITQDRLDEYLSRQCLRTRLRIAILQGIIDKVPIDQLSRRHQMSRQGIYNLVKRVNVNGIKGLETAGSGRPRKLTAGIAKDL
jgi:hypothetical protein